MWDNNEKQGEGLPAEAGAERPLPDSEGVFRKIVLYRLLPVLMVVLSLSCLSSGWLQVSDSFTEDLGKIRKYVNVGGSLLEKYLGKSELAGIDPEEIDSVMALFSDGKLTPYEMFAEADTVRSTADSIGRIYEKVKIRSDTVESLNTLASSMRLFRYLFMAEIAVGILTVLLILFRKKIFGNWYFTVMTLLMTGWFALLIRSLNEKTAGEADIRFTLIPVIAVILSLPLIPYGKKPGA